MACLHPIRLPLCCLFLACLLQGRAAAAELGDAHVHSHIGQPLAADIELTSLESPDAPLQVRLASPEVYRGANVAMPAVLAGINLSVVRRAGRQFVHAVTASPVDAEHLHLFLELVDGGRRDVRVTTLWFTPDPTPAPVRASHAPEPEAPPAARAAPVPPAAAGGAIAGPGKVPALPRPAVAAAPVRKPARVAAEPGAPHRLAAPVSLPALGLPVARPAACTPQLSAEEIRACGALDHKNADLKAQLVTLEGKVKVLQVALGGAAAPEHAAAPAPVAAPAVAAPAESKKRNKKGSDAQPEPATPWLWSGAGVAALLALAGAGAWFFRRRKKSAQEPVVVPVAAALMKGVKDRLMPDDADARAAGPTLQ